MASEIVQELVITGIAPNATYGWNGGTLYVPLRNEGDLAVGYVEVTAPKISNDAAGDITTFLSTAKVFDDLSYGWGLKFQQSEAKRFFEPTFTAGSSQALAWTMNPKAALMPGGAVTDQSAAGFSFKEFEMFVGKLFGLDTLNYRVWSERSGTWQYYAGGGTGWTSTVLAGSVTGATNASPIVITSNSHGLSTNDIVTITGVGGNTAANNTNSNPTWTITKVNANSFSLNTSTGSGAYTSGGTWKAGSAGLRYEPTEITNIQQSATNYLIVGQPTGNARKSSDAQSSSPAWSEFTNKSGTAVPAQHFAQVGQDLYYSNTYKVYNRTASANVLWNVGDSNTNINRMLWWRNYLIITKPEGVWIGIPDRGSLQRLVYFTDRDDDNGKVLIVHGDNAYWNAGEGWFKWDGYNDPEQEIGEFDGNDNRAFYGGKVRGAFSDGRNLYLIYRVTTSDATPYYNDFVMIQNGKTLGYHPVFVASSTTSAPSNYVGGVFFGSNKLRYSIGTAATATTGYLLTDGKSPMSATSSPYTWSVGVITPFIDFGRDWVNKWIKEVKVSTKDISSTGTGALTLSYQRWSDTSYTAFPTTPTGTNDNVTMTPSAATESGNALTAGFTATKVRFKVELTNSGSATQKEKMFYVRSLHAIGAVFYPPALQATALVALKFGGRLTNRNNKREYVSDTVLAGLRSALAQTAPMNVTLPDGTSALMTAKPNGRGFRYEDITRDSGEPIDAVLAIDFQEMK